MDGILDLAREWGPGVAILVLLVWGSVKEWWVFGPRYVEMRSDRDFWRNIALEALDVAENSEQVAEKMIRKQPR